MKKLYVLCSSTLLGVTVLLSRSLVAQDDRVEMALQGGVHVPIITVTALSSETTKKGHILLAVDSSVTIFGVTVIAKGAPVWGTVVAAEPSGHFGHDGKLGILIDSVQTVDSQRVALATDTNTVAPAPGTAASAAPGTGTQTGKGTPQKGMAQQETDEMKAAVKARADAVKATAIGDAKTLATNSVLTAVPGAGALAGVAQTAQGLVNDFRKGKVAGYAAGTRFHLMTATDVVVHVPKPVTADGQDSTAHN